MKAQPRIDYRGVSIEAKGRRWSARWSVEDGKVQVDSAYGSGSAPAGKDPKATAEGLLRLQVEGRA